jgi:hypothetical protein
MHRKGREDNECGGRLRGNRGALSPIENTKECDELARHDRAIEAIARLTTERISIIGATAVCSGWRSSLSSTDVSQLVSS